MRNNVIIRKLNSERGASIIIALFLLMLCSVLGALILTAATANSGKNIYSDDEEQAYLDVRSAVWLMRDSCLGCCFKETKTKQTTTTTEKVAGVTTQDGPNVDNKPNKYDEAISGSIDEAIKNMAKNIRANVSGDQSITLTIDPSSTAFKTVTATVLMDTTYNIRIVFHRDTTDGASDYPMTLCLQADVNEYVRTVDDTRTTAITGGTRTVVDEWEYTYFDVKWKSYEIIKGE